MGKERELSEGEMEDDGVVEEETTDSLDIKPPQAQRAEKKHKKKSGKEKKHGKHKHRRSDEARLTERYESTKYHRRERGNYVDYLQHPSRPGREQPQQQQQQQHQQQQQQQQQRYEQNYRGDRVEYMNYKRQYQERGRGHGHQRYERQERHPERVRPERRRPPSPDAAPMKASDTIVNDLRNKLLMKNKKSRHEDVQKDEEERHKEEKVKKEEDEELVARRARLLEADREKERRTQVALEELEARRKKRREKDEDSPTLKKKKRDGPETPREDVVMVSDHSEESDDTESDSKSEEDSGSEESPHTEKSTDGEVPVSPLSVGELSKSERRRRSDSRQRHLLESSRSGTMSPHSASGSETTHSDSRSPSRSRSGSPDKRHRSPSGEPSSPPKQGPKTPTSPVDEKKEPEVELPSYFPAIQGCRSVEEFQCLNRIEEGTYGVVYRAKDKRTEEIVALKRLKMEKEKEGFPITSLREINTLLKGQHPNIVTVREIVVGSNMDKIFIVMDYVEHDLKSLMETMKHKKQFFLPGEVKCLLQQLLRAVGHLHDNWILHRDLKTSNLLLSHKGILKVGDFGLAREYGSPLKPYTPIVVTLWYRATELLLGCKEYSTPIDIWSVGCIFAEFLSMQPLFPGKSEVDQLNRIFKDLGTPNERIWPGYNELPAVQRMTFTEHPVSNLRKKFSKYTSELGLALLQGLLTYDPKQRLTAEKGLQSTYFTELPLPIDPAMFPTWPAKSELGLKKALASSPKPPSGGTEFKRLGEDVNDPAGFVLAGVTFAESRQLQMGPGFSLRF